MKDEQLLRYGKQMLVPGFGPEGQEKLFAAKVLIVGIGGLGCPAALYLARSGVGSMILADDDRVELDNLYRQILYQDDMIGEAKTKVAARTLTKQCPELRITVVPKRMHAEHLLEYIPQVDIVLDASDNYDTRSAINQTCFTCRKPLVSAAAIRAEGQLAVFDFRDGTGPCYSCLYPLPPEDTHRCSDQGVIGAVVGLMGLYQALETIKLLTGYGEANTDKLTVLDATTGSWRCLSLTSDEDCDVCGKAT